MNTRTKVVIKNFSYLECDDFAAYLTKMAAQGWKLKKWGMGLVFEECEPSEEIFCVEVFPKGSEWDYKAEEDAEEYAEYCREAGWEFVEAKRKFCIFRKIREDPLPIVTPQERMENIKKAEWKNWRSNTFTFLMLSALQILQFSTFNSGKRWLFSNIMLSLCMAVHFALLCKLLQGAMLSSYWKRTEKKIDAGDTIYYGTQNIYIKSIRIIGKILFTLVYFSFLIICFLEKQYAIFAVLAITLLLIFSIEFLFAVIRPSRYSYPFLALMIALTVCFFSILVSYCLIKYGHQNLSMFTDISKEEAPLSFGAYGEGERSESILGNMEKYRTENLEYEIYESSYSWVLDRVWKLSVKEKYLPGEDQSKLWDSDMALHITRWQEEYYVRNEDTLWIFSAWEPLNVEQIREICRVLR